MCRGLATPVRRFRLLPASRPQSIVHTEPQNTSERGGDLPDLPVFVEELLLIHRLTHTKPTVLPSSDQKQALRKRLLYPAYGKN